MSTIIDDLRIEAEVPPKAFKAGTAVPVTLHIVNTAARDRVIVFIMSETFRFGQSTFRFRPRSLPTQVQPIPRDGYVARDFDFHQLAPHGRLTFNQTLHLPRTIPIGALNVEWEFKNSVNQWPTRFPNEGEPIEGIWTGRLTVDFTVKVSK